MKYKNQQQQQKNTIVNFEHISHLFLVFLWLINSFKFALYQRGKLASVSKLIYLWLKFISFQSLLIA